MAESAVAENTTTTIEAAAPQTGTVLGGDPKAAEAAAAAAVGGAAPQSEADKAAAAKAEADKKAADQAALDKELEGKTDAEKQAILKQREDAKKALEQKKPEGAPEKYADFKLPEGMALNADAVKEFTALAKDLNLPQDKAQKLVDLQTKIIAKEQQENFASFEKLKADWLDQSKKAFGADYEKEFSVASKGIERFGPPDLKKLLNETGVGNHPAFIKFANAIGKALMEDKFVEGEQRQPAKSTAELFYGETMGKGKA